MTLPHPVGGRCSSPLSLVRGRDWEPRDHFVSQYSVLWRPVYGTRYLSLSFRRGRRTPGLLRSFVLDMFLTTKERGPRSICNLF